MYLVHPELKTNKVHWITFTIEATCLGLTYHHHGITTIVLKACSFVVVANDGHLCPDMLG